MNIIPTLTFTVSVCIPHDDTLMRSRGKDVFAFLVDELGFFTPESVDKPPKYRRYLFSKRFRYISTNKYMESKTFFRIHEIVRNLHGFPELISFTELIPFFQGTEVDSSFDIPIAAFEVMQMLEQTELRIGVWLEPDEEDDAE